jgi:GTPase
METRLGGFEVDLTPRLPPPVLGKEVEEGSIEYKYHIHTAGAERLQRLASQLNWRLREGSGRCVYYLGVSDDGAAVGLDEASAAGSLAALRGMAAEVGAAVAGVAVHRAAARGGAEGSGGGGGDARVLRVELTRKAGICGGGGGGGGGGPPSPQLSPQTPASAPASPPPAAEAAAGGGGAAAAAARAPYYEPRVALLGAKGAGKSTLVAALSAGQLDDGAGSARGCVVRHRHELEAGCTSSAITCWTVGLDARGCLLPPARDDVSVASAGSEGHDLLSFRGAAPSDARVHARSASTVALLDLPGRRRCFRLLLSGLLGGAPHGALLLVDGAAARAAGGPCAATAAHAELLVALGVPFATVVTRGDLLGAGERAGVAAALRARGAAGGGAEPQQQGRAEGALVFVSLVTGEGLPEVARLLWLASAQWPPPPRPPPPPPPPPALLAQPAAALAVVLDTFFIGRNLVVGCLCMAGALAEGTPALVGPLDDGALHAVTPVSVHVRGGAAPDGALRAGELGSVSLGPAAALGLRARRLRRGCVLLGAPPGAPPPALPLAKRVRAAPAAPPAAAAAAAAAGGAGGAAPHAKWREGVSAVLVGASGLKAQVSIAARAEGGALTLELPRAEYVPDGRGVLWDGGVGALVVDTTVEA